MEKKDQSVIDKIINDVEAPFFEYGVKKYGWHLSIKVALEHFGVMSQHDRMPLMPLPPGKSSNFKKVLNNLPVMELIDLI